MPTVLLRCQRQNKGANLPADWISQLSSEFTPHNASERKPVHAERENLSLTVFHPRPTTLIRDTSCLTGYFESVPARWDIPDGHRPDGDYALFRADNDEVEISTDAAGSRSIWYVFTPKELIASTSQRAIIMLLQSFRFNHDHTESFLAGGHMVSEKGWDARIQRLPADAALWLQRKNWRLTVEARPRPFRINKQWSDADAKETLQTAMQDVCSAIPGSSAQVLSLSGGIDSRVLLHLLNKKIDRTVTWHAPDRLAITSGDAAVAAKLAENYQVKHQAVEIDEPSDWSAFVDHFVRLGEGQTDNMGGYLDDFALWQQLEADGIETMFRGDQMMGCTDTPTKFDVRQNSMRLLLSDYIGLGPELFDLKPSPIPTYLKRRWGESLATWRDRNFRNYYQPTLIAPLHDIKTPYLDIATPLLHRDILDITRQLPDHLRTDKALFRQIAADWLPELPLAKHMATHTVTPVAQRPALQTIAQAELQTDAARQLLPQALLQYATKEKPLPTARRRRGQQKTSLSADLLAVRSMLLSKTNAMFERDAALLRR